MPGISFVSLESMDPIKSSDFSAKHLKLSGVWMWSQDLYDSEDSLVPVPMTEDALAEAETLLIHAKLRTATGKEFDGLIVYQIGVDQVFAVEILTNNEKFTLNKNVADISTDELKRLATIIGDDASEMLPISYQVVPRQLAIETGLFSF
jgi:hypothetical protein